MGGSRWAWDRVPLQGAVRSTRRSPKSQSDNIAIRLTSSSGSSNATHNASRTSSVSKPPNTSAAPARIFSSSAWRSASSSAGTAGAPILSKSSAHMLEDRHVRSRHRGDQRRNGDLAKAAHGTGSRVRHLIDRAVEALHQRFDGARITQYPQLPYDYRPAYLFTFGLTQQCEKRLESLLALCAQRPCRRMSNGDAT